MNEFEYIDWLRQQLPAHPQVVLGPGDDCAIVQPTAGLPWLVTTDMLLEGSHFRLADTTPRRIGRKAMAVNLSDIAAMGGRPVAAVVSVGLPRGHETRLLAQELFHGLRAMADAFDTAIVGGDTNSNAGGLVLAVTLFGEPGPQGPIRRSGAQPGDWLLVSGPLGGSIHGKHFDFTPRVREALQLQDHAALHAMIDVSDGLAADVHHLCTESGCGAVLFAHDIPISPAAHLDTARTPLDHALNDGEDFELVVAVSAADGERLLQTQPIGGVTLTRIGVCTGERAYLLESDGQREPLEPRGYVHSFTSPPR